MHTCWNCQKAMRLYAPTTKMPAPAASPSSPSVTLTLFEKATPMNVIQSR